MKTIIGWVDGGLRFIKSKFFEILAVVMTFVTFYCTNKSFYEQKNFENQRVSYTKLIAAGNSCSQTKTLFYDNQLELYFLQKVLKLGPKPGDSLEMIKRRDLDIEYLKQKTVEEKEFLEMVALAQISFKMNKELQAAIDTVIKFEPYQLKQYPPDITLNNIDPYFYNLKDEAYKHINLFDSLRHHLTDLLRKQMDEN